MLPTLEHSTTARWNKLRVDIAEKVNPAYPEKSLGSKNKIDKISVRIRAQNSSPPSLLLVSRCYSQEQNLDFNLRTLQNTDQVKFKCSFLRQEPKHPEGKISQSRVGNRQTQPKYTCHRVQESILSETH